MSMKIRALRELERTFPTAYLRLRDSYRQLKNGRLAHDPHAALKHAGKALLMDLCDPAKTSLDVGAHKGDYAALLGRRSKSVIAFEPIPRLADWLRNLAERAPYEMRVEQCALSDEDGSATLRVPRLRPGSSTLQADNVHVNRIAETEEIETIEIRTRRLDDFELDAIGCMKVDVEGHQLPLLAGAEQTLRRCKPNVFMEIDEAQQEGAIAAVSAVMEKLGYLGFFQIASVLLTMELFDRELYHGVRNWQDGKMRINDFIFIHEDELAPVRQRCAKYIFHTR